MVQEAFKENSEFIELVSANQGIIFKICNTYCKNAADREDLAQEIVIQLWLSFPRYKPECKYSTWMYRIALNTAISFYRSGKKRFNYKVEVNDKLLLEDLHEAPPEYEQRIQLLEQFINELKELDKALMLLYLEDRSYREISEILDITETNVSTKINRIKEKLKQKFNSIKHGSN